MLLSLTRLPKLGGGKLVCKDTKAKTLCRWSVEPALVVELERDRGTFAVPYVTRINSTDILSDINGNYPSLCYNSILKKWFCISMDKVCVLSTDSLELKRLKQKYDAFDETNGFCDSAINAIARWNVNVALELMASTFGDIYE